MPVVGWSTRPAGRAGVTLNVTGSPSRTALVRKVKPLVRLAERETAAYALLRGIDYIVEECPMVEGNT